ncbi:hypothetical protein [Enterococcus sp. AZ050]|uniref:hypothetical protein n=1 Tax=Enterococcus sp. AZ050 TaxID=2774696 RepID=UPI003F68D433
MTIRGAFVLKENKKAPQQLFLQIYCHFFTFPPILRGGRACYTTATNIAIFSKKMSDTKQNNHF